MVILNTCHIREKASEKVFAELGRLRAAKRARQADGADMIIAVAGCVAQAEGEEIMRRAPYVDVVLGPQTYHRLPEMVARAFRAVSRRGSRGRGAGILDTEFPVESKFDHLPETAAPQGTTAFLTVQEGCDKFCTFCVVPYTRGAEFSRSVDEVTAEARRLVDAGAREITLLGQNVNAYHGAAPRVSISAAGSTPAEWGLGRLIRQLAEIAGLQRIRYTTSHPRDMDDELIEAHGDVPALMPYLHLPVQSGSDRVLAAMNRQHTADDYRRIVERLRRVRPDIALSSDFIVGSSRRRRCRFRSDAAAGRGDRLCPGLLVQVQPAARHACGGDAEPDSRSRQIRTARSVAGIAAHAAGGIQSRLRRPDPDRCCSTAPAVIAANWRAARHTCSRCRWRRRPLTLGRIAEVEIRSAQPNSLTGCLVADDAPPIASHCRSIPMLSGASEAHA